MHKFSGFSESLTLLVIAIKNTNRDVGDNFRNSCKRKAKKTEGLVTITVDESVAVLLAFSNTTD
jgi:hypothetical protein